MTTTQTIHAGVDKRFRTLKRAAAETGASVATFKRLIKSGRLTKFKIARLTYISLQEWESIPTPIPVKTSNDNADVKSV